MRSATIAIVLGFAGVAEAAPVAKLDADVDEDGVADHLELGADGVLHVGGRTPLDAKLAADASGGRIAIAHSKARPLIVVEVTRGTEPAEAVVLGFDRVWHEVIRFPIGGVGADKDYAIEVDATPAGVVRYQRVQGARRCDGRPAYLFPEVLDVATKQFSSVKPPIGIDENAPRLQARLDGTASAAPLVYKAHLASTQPGATDAGSLGIPVELDDGRIDTVWREELASDGKGQFFTFEPRAAGGAKTIRIVPGNPTSATAMRAANRPQRLGVATGQGTWWIELPDPAKEPLGAAYIAELPIAVTGCVTVILDKTYAGTGNITSLAELEVYADGERIAGGGEAMLARSIAEGGSGAVNAAAVLARRGAVGAIAIETELAKTTDVTMRRRLVKALAINRDPAAIVSLVKAATDGWIQDKDLLDVIDALGALDQHVTLQAIAGNAGLAPETRIAAVQRIRPTSVPGLTTLVELAGTGPRELRRAVIDTLATGPLATLLQIGTTTAGISPDVWRAVTKQARTSTDQAARATALAALLAGLAAAPDYAHRYRMIDGVATLGDAAALRTLEQALRALPASTESAALRQVAIRGIAASPRTEAIPLVIALAANDDPGVRLAALGALASADGEPGGPWHAPDGPDGIDRVIITALSTDRWPEVRRRAAESLGDRCIRLGPATALVTAVGKDRDVGVRIGSLTALVQCKASDVTALLTRLWDDGKAPLELRSQAVDLTVSLADPSLGPKLIGKLASWRGAAIESKPALVLAQHAAAAIGRLAPPGAAQALMAALDDSAYPEIVGAAALGLGALGPACPPAAKTKLTALAREDENLAVAAKRAAAQCGK